MEKAIICDDILRRFKGNGALYWAKLRDEFKADEHTYFVTENNINYLIAQGMIKRNNSIECLNLTEKGFATLAEIDTLGYVTQENERSKEEAKSRRRMNIDRSIQIIILIISLAALIVAVVALMNSHS
jgi:hypothetical protein